MKSVTLQALEEFPAQLESYYAAVPAGFKDWSPLSWEGIPSESLTAVEQIGHILDVEVLGYHVRLRRTLNEFRPKLESLDTYGLAKGRAHLNQNMELVLSEFRAARLKTISLVSRLSPEELRREAVFEGYGSLSLQSLVHYLCSHDQQHLAGLQWLIGKIEAQSVKSQA